MLLCLSLCLLHLSLSLSLFLCLSLSFWSTGSNSTFLVSVPRSWHISDFREQSTLRTKPELRTGAKQAMAPSVAIARPGKHGLTAYASPAEELPLGTGKVSGSVLLTTPFFPLSTLTRDQNLAGTGIQQPWVARLPREAPLSLQNVPPVSEHKPQASAWVSGSLGATGGWWDGGPLLSTAHIPLQGAFSEILGLLVILKRWVWINEATIKSHMPVKNHNLTLFQAAQINGYERTAKYTACQTCCNDLLMVTQH